MNLNYKILKSMKNFDEMWFLNKDINLILDSNDINKNFKKIMLIYDIMNGKNINVINIMKTIGLNLK